MSRKNTPALWKVKRARHGLGLFAERDFKRGEQVIEYTGERIDNAEADRRCGRYIFKVDTRWNIDGRNHEDTARYINHSCKPNCEPMIDGKRIFIFAKRNILAGEELTYNYGKEYFDEFIKPKGCGCDACME